SDGNIKDINNHFICFRPNKNIKSLRIQLNSERLLNMASCFRLLRPVLKSSSRTLQSLKVISQGAYIANRNNFRRIIKTLAWHKNLNELVWSVPLKESNQRSWKPYDRDFRYLRNMLVPSLKLLERFNFNNH